MAVGTAVRPSLAYLLADALHVGQGHEARRRQLSRRYKFVAGVAAREAGAALPLLAQPEGLAA